MAENSAIEWTDCTFNPWMGCTKVSSACKHCYAETLMDIRYGKVQWGPKGLRKRTSTSNWRKPHQWNERQRQWREAAEAAGVPYQRPRVFCASLADVFEGAETMSAESRPVVEQARRDLWALIEATPELDWLLLTKRPKNVVGMVPEAWVGCGECGHRAFSTHPCPFCDSLTAQWPSNVWLGTTVEDQKSADERIPHLLRVPATVRFLSVEPLLGPVDLACWIDRIDHCNTCEAQNPPQGPDLCPECGREGTLISTWGHQQADDYVSGRRYGESGHGARPSHPRWFRSLRDQCIEAGVPFLFKQWGAWAPDCLCDKRVPCAQAPRPDLPLGCMFRCGKKAAGRLLDGRTWDEVPRT